MFVRPKQPALNPDAKAFVPPPHLLPLRTPTVATPPIAIVKPIPIRPASAGKESAHAAPVGDSRLARSAPADMGHAPRPQGNPDQPGVELPKPPKGWESYPHFDEKTHANYEALRYFENRPGVGHEGMWSNGNMPFFPTSERAPTRAEAAAIRDFAEQINAHRKDQVRSGLPPTYLHRLDPFRNGEYGAMYALGPGGRPVRQDFKYNEGDSVALQGQPDTKLVMHSHPIVPSQGPLTDNDLAYRMPSMTDHQIAALDHMRSKADNYLIYGDRVTHFDGRSLEVTELRPSPLEGRLPATAP